MKYKIILLSALIMEICSTFYIRFTACGNGLGMFVFSFIGPFLALPFAGYMVESKLWSERLKMALFMAIGYSTGSLIVNYIYKI
jgi:hypothetical protein